MKKVYLKLHELKDLEIKFKDEMMKFEEVSKMPYVTSFERIGFKQGMEKGIEEGRKEGLKEGLKEKIDIVKKLFKKKFSLEDISEITGLSQEEIKKIIS